MSHPADVTKGDADLVPRRWLPMDAAPRDGTRVLLSSGSHVTIGRWSPEAKFGGEDMHPGWQIFDCEMDEWYAVAIEEKEVEGWMPLPQPIFDKRNAWRCGDAKSNTR